MLDHCTCTQARRCKAGVHARSPAAVWVRHYLSCYHVKSPDLAQGPVNLLLAVSKEEIDRALDLSYFLDLSTLMPSHSSSFTCLLPKHCLLFTQTGTYNGSFSARPAPQHTDASASSKVPQMHDQLGQCDLGAESSDPSSSLPPGVHLFGLQKVCVFSSTDQLF